MTSKTRIWLGIFSMTLIARPSLASGTGVCVAELTSPWEVLIRPFVQFLVIAGIATFGIALAFVEETSPRLRIVLKIALGLFVAFGIVLSLVSLASGAVF